MEEHTNALALAPVQPRDPIAMRRWWNQICIVALTHGISTNCYLVEEIYDKETPPAAFQLIRCNRCEIRADITCHPERAFIGCPEPEPEGGF